MASSFRGRDSTNSVNNKHKKAVEEVVMPVVNSSDIVLEILDARFIDETRNKEIEERITKQNKKIIYVLNKIDLVSLGELHKKIELENLRPYILFSCKERKGLRELRNRIKIEAKRILKDKRDLPSDFKYLHLAYVGVIGYPNTGKSSVINMLMGKTVAPSSPIAGFTKGMQKLKLSENIMLLDTPGIIPREENSQVYTADLKKHGIIGVETWQKVRQPDMIVIAIMQEYPGVLEKHYNIEAKGDADVLIQELGRQKHFLKKGGIIDSDRTSRLIVKDWQAGKIKPSG